ncbi:dihydrofolate reductase family protein [Pseudonocardia sp. S2-4]|uniref:Dihydrofolate reductase family protein n=1 Tax=Pseudonocardia humida TaxID=2800819 RepID=A0ABT1A828_9PSEU|nr:dihydrofolate reductase family protein [Pseudonocardia humida]
MVAGLLMSMDGVVESVDGWEEPLLRRGATRAAGRGIRRIDALLIGRRTFDGHEQLRNAYPDAPVLGLIDATPTYVVPSTLRHPPRPGTHLLDGRITAHITRLLREGDGDLQVLGGPTLVRSRWREGLIAATACRPGDRARRGRPRRRHLRGRRDRPAHPQRVERAGARSRRGGTSEHRAELVAWTVATGVEPSTPGEHGHRMR